MKNFQANVNIFKGQFKKRVLAKKAKRKITKIDNKYLNDILKDLGEETVFIHCGLGNVKRAFETESPYIFLMNMLEGYFTNILVPGFTLDYFKQTGIYHKKFSKPHEGVGVFSKLFLEKDANYRTNDCIHSILVKGAYNFDECNHFDSFSKDGCFGKLDKENILILNIGTDELKASQIHYVDYNYNPNIIKKGYEGIIYYDETTYEKTTQLNFESRKNKIGLKYNWNRDKIVYDLEKAGMLHNYSFGNFKFYAFKSSDIRVYLSERLKKDPYYLII